MPAHEEFYNEIEKQTIEIVSKVIMPFIKTPSVPLYHYTRYEGLRGIIADKCFHITDIRFMNDAGETTYARNVIREAIDKRIDTTDEDCLKEFLSILKNTLENSPETRLFAFCMSERDDDISQWRAYASQTHGHSGGYAIGFNWMSSSIASSILFPNEATDHPDLVLLNVIYDQAIQKSIIENILKKVSGLYKSVILNQALGRPSEISDLRIRAEFLRILRFGLRDTILRFKNPVFKAEGEWRLISAMHQPDLDGSQKSKLRYRSGPLGLTPFVEISPLVRAGNLTGRLPITFVRQGPRYEPDLALGALREFINIHGYSFVVIQKSAVPIRF